MAFVVPKGILPHTQANPSLLLKLRVCGLSIQSLAGQNSAHRERENITSIFF